MSEFVGLDIGGANLKASDGRARSLSTPFPLWQQPHLLSDALKDLLATFPAHAELAVTMTGELADCYRTRELGVQSILDAVEQAAGSRAVHVWQTGGEFCSLDEARELTPLVAAANWHALATWGARSIPTGRGLLIDLGSTTCDIIPLQDGAPCPSGLTDRQRLTSGELVYAGVRRTPLCALLPQVELNGASCGVAAELFATTLDLFLISGEIPEDPACTETANGQAATRTAALDRVARMLCTDTDDLAEEEILSISGQFRKSLINRLLAALRTVVSRFHAGVDSLLLSGEGEFLLKQILRDDLPDWKAASCLSLTQLLGPEHSSAACAYALARLAQERCG